MYQGHSTSPFSPPRPPLPPAPCPLALPCPAVQMKSLCGGHSCYLTADAKMQKDTFAIKHYAGKVLAYLPP